MDRAALLTAELLAGNNGDLLTLGLFGVQDVAQVHVMPFSGDLCHLLHGLGMNPARLGGFLVKEPEKTLVLDFPSGSSVHSIAQGINGCKFPNLHPQ